MNNFRIMVLIFILHSCSNSGENDKFKSFISEDNMGFSTIPAVEELGFSLRYPQNWIVNVDYEGVDLVAYNPIDTISNFVEHISVIELYRPNGREKDVDLFSFYSDNFKIKFSEFNVLYVERGSANFMKFSSEINEEKVFGYFYLFQNEEKVYSLTFLTTHDTRGSQLLCTKIARSFILK